jgi:hypothetical protein
MTIDWPTGQWLIGIAVSLIGTLIPGAIAVWRAAIWVSGEFKKRDDAIDQVSKDATLAVQAANERAKLAEQQQIRELADMRVHVVEQFVTKDTMAEALHGVQTSIDRLGDLLNQLLVQAAGRDPLPPSPPRQRPSRG